MKLSKRVFYALLLFIILFSIGLRYPLDQHENGADSFEYHGISNELASSSYAPWLMHPLSFFGLYPYSTEAGPIFLMAGVSQLIDFEMEFTILIVAIILGIFGTLATYLLGKEIIKDNFFALSFAFVYQATNSIKQGTTWIFDTRTIFMIILPLFIWALLRSYNQPQNRMKYIPLSIILFIILGTIHNIWFISFVFIFAYFATIFIYKYRKIILPKRAKKVLPLGYISLLLLFLLFLPLMAFDFYSPSLDFYKDGYFFKGDAFYIILANVGAEYSMALSILVIFIPLGIIYLLLKKNKTMGEMFALILPLFYVTFIFDQLYSRTVLVLAFSLLIGLGIFCSTSFISKIKKIHHLIIPLILSLLIFSALLPYFVVVRPETSETHIGISSAMDYETYNAALFTDVYMKDNVYICSDSKIDQRINCISDAHSMTAIAPSGDIIYEFVNPDDGTILKRKFTVKEFIYYQGQMYYSKQPISRYWLWYMFHFNYDSAEAKKCIKEYNIKYFIVNDRTPGKVPMQDAASGVVKLVESPFYNSIIENKYKIYDDGLESIFSMGSIES